MQTTTAQAIVTHNNPPIRESLALEFEEMIASLDLLAIKADSTTDPDSDKALGALSDLSKEIAALVKRAETARVGKKEPYLAGGREVDGFFKPLTDRAQALDTRLKRMATTFLRHKAEEERRIREEDARIAREEAARQMREAEAREAEARAERNADQAAMRQAESDRALDAAAVAERDANAADKAVAAKPAEHARTRGEASLATLATFWNFEIIDVAAIPLEQLRPYIPRADLEKAIRAHVRVLRSEPIPGVRIFEDTQARIV